MHPRPRLRRARAFTLVEMVVVLALLALIMGFALPRLGGTTTFAEDQKAQTTASGALDVTTQLFTTAGVRDGQGCTAPPSNGTRGQMTWSVNPTTGALTPYDTTATNCPVFANTTSLAAATGDVSFTTGDQPSTSSGLASVAAARDSATGGWRIAAAVLSPQGGIGKTSVSSCWMVWRQFPGDSTGSDIERYFSHTNVSAADAGNCTGDVALGMATTVGGDAFCDSPPTGPPLGRSWRKPCTDYASTP